MKHIQGSPRSQTLLLPACVDDYVGPDNVVRFVEAFVNSLDLATAGFERTQPKATGRPGYDLGDLLKLYIYGYLKRVRSSRRLEAETHRNLEEKIVAIKERRARLEDHRAELEASGEDQISLTDLEARAMHSSSRIGVGYNIQIAVDTKYKLIAEQQVHNNVSDLGLLSETANAAREIRGR